MQAYELQNSFGLENLTLVDRPKAAIGASDVRVAVHACSLNFRDLLMVNGQYNPRQPLPLIPCTDAAGVVVEVGEDVNEFVVGDWVCSTFFTNFSDAPIDKAAASSSRGGPEPGVLRTSFVSSENGLVRAPEHLELFESATLPCAALTAWTALFEEGDLSAGDTVLIQGTGGVSMFAFLFARAAGATVFATTSSQEKADWLSALGAEAVFNYREDEKWGRAVKSATGGRGVDYVVEVGGAGTLGQSLNAVAVGGMIAMIGVLSGGVEPLSVIPILMRHVRVQGILVGHRAAMVRMIQFIERHKIHPIISDHFAFAESVSAFEHMASASHRGKIVIDVTHRAV